MENSPTPLNALITQVLDAHPGADPLARVEAACQTAADLDEVADHLVGHFVDEARTAGFTWTQIGEHIGVTKQAARKRFAPRDVPDTTSGTATRANVFGRYTDRARHVVVLAQENARQHGHPLINTEHILLGICQEDQDTGAEALEASGVSVTDLQTAVTARLAPASTHLQGHIPFAHEGKKTLELAARANLLLGHDQIGTGHLLLGLIEEGTGLAAQVLAETGITAQRAEAEIVRLLNA
jgi:Clp amino terminal domain, pathogenicity island component